MIETVRRERVLGYELNVGLPPLRPFDAPGPPLSELPHPGKCARPPAPAHLVGPPLNAENASQVMTQEEMVELLGMTSIHAWRVSRCKDITDGNRRWTSKGQVHAAPYLQSTQPAQHALAACATNA